MREILFRGKRKDNGEWVEGGVAFEDYTDKVYIVRWNTFGLGFFEYIEVIPETLGQYTGLPDINGKKIFEGDIVLAEGRTGSVVYSEENCVWYVAIEYGFEPPLNDFDRLYIKVIGNIHDGPELLEVYNG